MEWRFKEDKHNMNWFREDFEYAQVLCKSDALSFSVEHAHDGDLLKTKITFTNESNKPVFTSIGDIGICFPLEDKYESSEICITKRCHTHIFCGENISYIMALRMGGEAPHLGMVLTEGSLRAYSVERNYEKMSNDRGCFILHPTPMEILPGESKQIAWTLFPHQGKDDFYTQIAKHSRFAWVEAERYVLFQGEEGKITVTPAFNVQSVSIDGIQGKNSLSFKADTLGEKTFEIRVDDIKTICRILVQPPLNLLTQSRRDFIVKNQQYHGLYGGLDGAYLPYDNEEEHLYYQTAYDHNGGRERVGMGLLLIQNADEITCKSLKEYKAYVLRELVDSSTGDVFNDIGRDDSYERLYNMPWYATLFVSFYNLDKNASDLITASNIIRRYYDKGGAKHYAIELPVLSLCKALKEADLDDLQQEMTRLFATHGTYIMAQGKLYPPFEVNFEQSIVAPAANILLQLYLLTGENAYLEAGKEQLDVLTLFNGLQPDYRQYETAIRHWDGYWFGKRKVYGDTYPHYWSALTGNAYFLYWQITGDDLWLKKAEHSFRGVLPLFLPEGRATCAHVFPYMVNGQQAGFNEPNANDQDWGLYFINRFMQEKEGKK